MKMDQPTMFRGYLTDYQSSPVPIRYDVAILETRLYRMPDGTLIWSGTTETIDRPHLKEEVEDFAQRVIRALEKGKLL
jgi:hypothetical protein